MNKATIAIIAGSNIEWITKKDLKLFDYTIGVDRGAIVSIKKNIPLDCALGDFDSISAEEKDLIDHEIKDVRVYSTDKDQTDLEIAVVLALSMNPKQITLFGVTGGRFDHTIAGIHLLEKIHRKGIYADSIDEKNHIVLLKGKTLIQKQRKYTYLSIIPITNKIKVSMKGCVYDLDHYQMVKGTTLGVSNVITSNVAEIFVHEGSAYCVLSRD